MNRRDVMTLLAAVAAASPLSKARAAGGDVRGYGMKPDASPAANAAALQRCLNDNIGAPVTIPGADADYQLAGKISAPANTSIVLGDGARLRWVSTQANGSTFMRSPTRPGIEVLGDNFRLTGKGQIIGPSHGAYVAQEIGIVCVGGDARTPRRGFEISDGVEILNWGGIGVATQFVQNVKVVRTSVHDCGYGGMRFLSCQNGAITSNSVGAIGPGADGNAYGISCSHDSLNYGDDPHAATNGRLAANPFCTSFEVAGNTVFDIPLWAGVDFHGAYECQAHNNRVYNCRHGLLLQGSSNAGGDFAGENNSVVSNLVTTARMNGEPTTITAQTRLGISVNGGKRVQASVDRGAR